MSLSCANPIEPSESQSVLLASKIICVFRLNSVATGSLTYRTKEDTQIAKPSQVLTVIQIKIPNMVLPAESGCPYQK